MGIKQHLKLNSEKIKQHRGWVEKKSVAYKKSVYFFLDSGEGESDENDDSDFEILLHFEAVIAAE